ncbi:glycerol kinase GlpK [Companilactobacillus kimchii]|uniref:Glycerol kinase n=2 Tax=Companilactobacillus kimchii TaxID=2801452 RepID=A0ABR5NRG2_9LACO|nr:glycerol kinase GlpK [Companilactobacillus kimchii]GEO48541.1 glycerol kinase 1 [Companilactobacillus paralimentarius]KAE9559270.1 glycerol kinase [Companilactobacillus kimchii]KAE9560793.1 glycerol kinase [Companilactobacillus kimchii]KRK50654.1 glycerol kinase [Companilactobacillus kimchii DSM 13961 = JCM 10707]OWF32412.1 Glycerol kinase [Companilactobacillus kimchii]
MDKDYILAIDEGTTTTRAIIFDHNGQQVAMARHPIRQILPNPGWVEHEPNEIWNAVQTTIATALIDSGIKPKQIKAIGIASQRETTVVWDKKTGLPIYNAIVWQSRQTSRLANDFIKAGYKDEIHQKTGLIIGPYFSATKIRWILDHVDGAQERAEKGELLFGTINTWLLWKLTDGESFMTDCANASRTMLYNINTLQWDDDLLKLFNIPKVMLPEVKSNSEVFGITKNYQFYGSEIPIAGMTGSQQASLFGQMAFEPGMVKNTYGTGAFAVMNTGNKPAMSDNNLLTTIAYGINGEIKYALEGSVFVAGAALQWLRDDMKLIHSTPATSDAAKSSIDNNEVYVVPAFAGLGAPYWDNEAHGTIFGLTRGTTDKDVIKATLQAIAYQTKDIIETMSSDSKIPIEVLKVDGAASANDYLMQFQADILGISLQRSSELETTSLGVAFMAGLGVGYWKDLDDIKKNYQTGKTYQPKMSESVRTNLYDGWKDAVEATMAFKHNI